MSSDHEHGQHHPAGDGENYTKLLIAIALGLVVVLTVWGFAIASVGFAAFIYPLLALVGLAFLFTLNLTRA